MGMPKGALQKQRFVGIDLVKILACFLVVCIHFFLYTGFYAEPISENFGQPQIYFRWVAFLCVPLFMITTGYLMKNKTMSGKYYTGIIRVLVQYAIISVVCLIYNTKHFEREYTGWEIFSGFLNYSNAQYGWYVEYYICIFLIIPFLNLAYNGLKTQRQRGVLVIMVFALSILSQSLFFGFDLETQTRVVPGYFLRCYPIAYYYIGAYIRDYPPKRTFSNKLYMICVFVVCLVFLSKTTYSQSLDNLENNYNMLSWHYNDYGAWPVAVCATALFLLVFDITCSKPAVNKVISIISQSTFACYLISYVFDTSIYLTLCSTVPTVQERFQLGNMVPTILKIFGGAMVCGLVIQMSYSMAEKAIKNRFVPASVPAEVTVPANNPPAKKAPQNKKQGKRK